ncbi:54S ribosomal protein L2 mitochondrial [Perkinsus olseni]|uniref:54S ribosomal protein L2 mitochondrial n=1 Tax=Perkinsus olseni TaxID=32597 RepID=A0A7J6LJ59_PEROL|nr:54S ribosomal protein L2 mitochondrial [Perkinsus olseni]
MEQRLSLSDSCRLQRSIAAEKQAVKARIAYFKREENKIWRNLDEVKRQTRKLEKGRESARQRRHSLMELDKARRQREAENVKRALELKTSLGITKEQHLKNREAVLLAKREATRETRKESAEIQRMKRRTEARDLAMKSKRAVAIHQASIEAKLQVKAEKEKKLRRVREEAQQKRAAILASAKADKAELAVLEEEEMRCLQRLQNSRMISQSALQDLEISWGEASPLCSLLHSRGASSLRAGEGLPWAPKFYPKSKFHSCSSKFAPPPRAAAKKEQFDYSGSRPLQASKLLEDHRSLSTVAVESDDEGPPRLSGTPSRIRDQHRGDAQLMEALTAGEEVLGMGAAGDLAQAIWD